MTDTLSRTFAALADATRRDMLARLTEGEHTLTELAEPYEISVQAVSKHLRVLELAGLVERGHGTGRRPARLLPHALDVSALWLEEHRRRVEERYQRLDAALATMAAPQHPDSTRGAPDDHRITAEPPRSRDRGPVRGPGHLDRP